MMYKIIIAGCLVFFVWQLLAAWCGGVVMGKGSWGRVRYFSHKDQPGSFYVTVFSYLLGSALSLYALLFL